MRLSLAVLLLSGCAIPVTVGSFLPEAGGGSGSTGGGGGALDPCAVESRITAYQVTLAATDVDDPNCWDGGVVPVDHTLPAETFEVVIASKAGDATLGVAGLSAQRLGDVAVVAVGEGVAKTTRGFVWTQLVRTQGPGVDDAIEVRTTEATFEFDRLDTLQTAGSVTLTSLWECQLGPPPRNARCGSAPPDASGCAVTRAVTAVASTLPSRWSTPSTPPLDGAARSLVSLDLGAMSRLDTQCGIAGQPLPTSTLTPNLRALEVWQATPTTVRAPPRSYQLGVAPRIDVASDFSAPPGNSQMHTVDSAPTPNMKLTETTLATIAPRACGFFPSGDSTLRNEVISLQSSSDCTGSDCPHDNLGNPLNAFCRLELGTFSIPLP